MWSWFPEASFIDFLSARASQRYATNRQLSIHRSDEVVKIAVFRFAIKNSDAGNFDNLVATKSVGC